MINRHHKLFLVCEFYMYKDGYWNYTLGGEWSNLYAFNRRLDKIIEELGTEKIKLIRTFPWNGNNDKRINAYRGYCIRYINKRNRNRRNKYNV